MRLRIAKTGKSDNVALANYIGGLFFNSVKLEINNTQVFNSSNYAYKAYLETVLNYGNDQKNGFLQAAGFYTDSADDLDSPANAGYKARLAEAKDEIVDVVAPLHIDHFNTDRLLIPHLNLHIVLYRNSDAFVLESHDATPPVSSVSVETMSLFYKTINVIPSANLAVEKALLSHTAKYPYIRTRVKCIAIPGGRMELPFASIFTDIIPKRVIVGLVRQDAYDGNISHSPVNFKPYGVSEMSVDAGGVQHPSQPIQANFGTGAYAQAFVAFYENIGAIGENRPLNIGYRNYRNGYALHAFNLCATDTGSDFELIRAGTTQLHIKFAEKTPSYGLQAIIYAEYDGMYQIDQFRNVHGDQEA